MRILTAALLLALAPVLPACGDSSNGSGFTNAMLTLTRR